MASATEAYELLMQAQRAQFARDRFAQDAGDAFAYAFANNVHTSTRPQRPASRFDGPDVIDMALDADGVWSVPVRLEYRVRLL